MGALDFTQVEPTVVTRTRNGRQYLSDTEFCDSLLVALKQSYNDETFLSTKIEGTSELRKLRGALRYFANEQGYGLSLKTEGDEDDEDGTFTVTFRAQEKREMAERTSPRKVRRRKGESDDDYLARVQEMYPREKGEKVAAYSERLDQVLSM